MSITHNGLVYVVTSEQQLLRLIRLLNAGL